MIDADRAAERLTEEHTELTDAGPVEWPPLLEWLEQSITEVTGRSGGSSDGGAPFNEDALRLKKYIARRLRRIFADMYMPWGSEDLVEATKEVWARVADERRGGRMDDAQWELISDEVIDWVKRIEAEDNRPMSLPLERCPRCDATRVYPIITDDGERTYTLDSPDYDAQPKPAIIVEWDEGRSPVCECRNPECDGFWVGWSAIAKLGFTLGAAQDIAVLEACGIEVPTLASLIE